MEYLQKILKKSGWVSLIESLIFAILGIILIAKPEETVKVISYILGACFIIIGIYKIINYIQMQGKNDLYNYHLIYGIIGIWIIYTAAVRASSSFKLRRINSNIWIYTLILSIVMLICGLYIILNTGTIIVTIGVIMVIYAVIDIIENLIFLKHVNDL